MKGSDDHCIPGDPRPCWDDIYRSTRCSTACDCDFGIGVIELIVKTDLTVRTINRELAVINKFLGRNSFRLIHLTELVQRTDTPAFGELTVFGVVAGEGSGEGGVEE